jgi:F420-0:gamma-glutamyl ligase
MKVTALKTPLVVPGEEKTLEEFLDEAVRKLPENSVLAITSKIVAILEGRFLPYDAAKKKSIIEAEAEQYLDANLNQWHVTLAIKGARLIPNSGVDESNANGTLILWPEKPDRSADKIYGYLANRFQHKNFGVILTDSTTSPLRTGVSGIAISYCGLRPLNSLIGQEDLFGRQLKMTRVNVIEGLAASAVLVMGEGAECTPIALLEELDFVNFTQEPPSQEERASLRIALDEDLYAPFLKNAPWQTGGSSL